MVVRVGRPVNGDMNIQTFLFLNITAHLHRHLG